MSEGQTRSFEGNVRQAVVDALAAGIDPRALIASVQDLFPPPPTLLVMTPEIAEQFKEALKSAPPPDLQDILQPMRMVSVHDLPHEYGRLTKLCQRLAEWADGKLSSYAAAESDLLGNTKIKGWQMRLQYWLGCRDTLWEIQAILNGSKE